MFKKKIIILLYLKIILLLKIIIFLIKIMSKIHIEKYQIEIILIIIKVLI
jgi:hypothetical protein